MKKSLEPARSLGSQGRKIWRRIGKIFSWFAGLSLGSVFVGLLICLSVLAIFVRTEFFQNTLKERIVTLSQENLQATIEYSQADVSIFRLYPKLSFYDVRIVDQQTGVDVKLARVSVSISALVSLPLLFFQQIYISTAEVEGLQYELTDTEILRDWMDRINPGRSQRGLSTFTTTVREILFNDFILRVDLSEKDIFKRKISGQFELEAFEVQFEGDDVIFEGSFPFRQVQVGDWQIPDGEMSLDEATYNASGLRFRSARVESGEDYLELSGGFRDFENPFYDLRLELGAHLERFIPDHGSGFLEANLRYQGPLKKGKGAAELKMGAGRLRTRSFESLTTKLRLRDGLAEVLELQVKSGAEAVQASGTIGLWDRSKTALRVQLQNLDLSKTLGMIQDHLYFWRGKVNGTSDIRGDLLAGDVKLKLDATVEGFEIRNSNQSLRYAAPTSKADITLTAKNWLNADGDIFVNTEHSQWKSKIRWSDKDFWIDWFGETNGPMGKLFFFDLQTVGPIEGFYGGPFKSMDLKIVPNFSKMELNGYTLRNVRGQIDFDEKRQFVANPLLADGLRAEGGFLFPRVGEPQFYRLDFEVTNQQLLPLLNALPQTVDLGLKPLATFQAEGILEGRVDNPDGVGTIQLQDIRFSEEAGLGRSLKTQYRFDDGVFKIFDLLIQTSKDGGRISGEIDFISSAIPRAKLIGSAVRLSDWLLLMGVEVPLQSSLDFSLTYLDQNDFLDLNARFFDTVLGSRPQPPSDLEVKSEAGRLTWRGGLFDNKLRFASGVVTRNEIPTSLVLNEFNVMSFSSIFDHSALSWRLSGEGDCRIVVSSKNSRRSLLKRLLFDPATLECDVNSKPSTILRGSGSIHRIDRFSLNIKGQSGAPLRFSSEGLTIQTGRQRLQLSGFYQSADQLDLNLRGRIPLDTAAYLIPSVSRSDGVLDLNGNWNGRGYTGSAVIQEGLINFKESPILVRDLQANLMASNSNFELSGLRGSLREGDLEASGRFRLKNLSLENLQLAVQLNGTLVEPVEGVRFRASGPLQVRQDANGGQISGELTVYEGRFLRRINVRGDLAKMLQRQERTYEFFVKEESVFDPWKLNIGLNTSEAFLIRNNLGEGEVEANLRVVGTVKEPRLQGSMGIVRGRFSYFNKNFEIRTGSAQFNNPDSNIPRYDIQADSEIGEYRVFINVIGDANDQKISYSADPPLPEKDILALVSYGTPPSSSDQAVNDDTRTSAAYAGISYVTGQIQERIETTLSSDFGIRRFQLYPSFYEETGKTELQLMVGTDLIRNRLALNYSNYLSATGGHLVELDFKLSRNVSLVGSWRDTQNDQKQNISGDLGGDIIFRFEIE